MNTQKENQSETRILGNRLARELDVSELERVSGGTCPSVNESPDPHEPHSGGQFDEPY